jgi:putative glutamine amidotransferase
MRRPPLVGITAYGREAGPRGEQFSLPTAYVESVRAAGGLPMLIPPSAGPVEAVLESVDALVFAGGGDIDPELSGAAHETNYAVDGERDRFELALLEAALLAEVPTLAICRGLQLLNVARGGSLHAHLPDVFGEAIDHRVEPLDPVPHDVTLEADVPLAELYGTGALRIASWHHQAVDRLGEGLRPVAFAPDGVVEALELLGAPWLLAVQWHPELQQEPGSPQRLLFAELVRWAERRCR